MDRTCAIKQLLDMKNQCLTEINLLHLIVDNSLTTEALLVMIDNLQDDLDNILAAIVKLEE